MAVHRGGGLRDVLEVGPVARAFDRVPGLVQVGVPASRHHDAASSPGSLLILGDRNGSWPKLYIVSSIALFLFHIADTRPAARATNQTVMAAAEQKQEVSCMQWSSKPYRKHT